MADEAHRYSTADRAALVLFGAGRCYWPGCTEPLLGSVDGQFELRLEIAHIRSAKKGGERYVEGLSDKELSAFSNLIFLCTLHHKAVDKKGIGAQKYPIHTLEQWKADREKGGISELQKYVGVTEDNLAAAISEAMRQREDDVSAVLTRLEESDQEAAALLRELSAEVKALQHRDAIVDPDVVSMLDLAAERLVGLEDTAGLLNQAADRLGEQIDHMRQFM